MVHSDTVTTRPRRHLAVWIMTRAGNQVRVLDPAPVRPTSSGPAGQRFRWSGLVWWACQDLNLGPHPYQAHSRDAFMQQEREAPAQRSDGVTLVVRSVPGLSVRYGTRLAQTAASGQGEGRLAMVPRLRRGTIMWACKQN